MSPTPKPCPKCNIQFTPRRTNQTYCSSRCQKNASRQDRSGEYAQEGTRDAERIHDLTDAYVRNHRPEARPQFIANLIQAAIHGNRNVRRALSYRGTLRDEDGGRYPSIGQEADRVCLKVFGKSVAAFLQGHASFDPKKLASLNEYSPPPPKPDGWDYRTLLRGNTNPPPAYIYNHRSSLVSYLRGFTKEDDHHQIPLYAQGHV